MLDSEERIKLTKKFLREIDKGIDLDNVIFEISSYFVDKEKRSYVEEFLNDLADILTDPYIYS
jgi:hypothetical protein